MRSEKQTSNLNPITGHSVKARCKGTPSYLDPNRNSMQKPIGGLLVLPVFSAKNLSQHKNTEGKGSNKTVGAYPKAQCIYEGAIVSESTKGTVDDSFKRSFISIKKE